MIFEIDAGLMKALAQETTADVILMCPSSMCVCVCVQSHAYQPILEYGLEKRMEVTNMCRNQTFYVCVKFVW